jgi:hypothetical protein
MKELGLKTYKANWGNRPEISGMIDAGLITDYEIFMRNAIDGTLNTLGTVQLSL